MKRLLESIKENYMPLVRINAPEYYKDPEFILWLNSGVPATWHKPGTKAGEYSDVFVTICDGDGSDSPYGDDSIPGIPEHIWDEIVEAVQERLENDIHAEDLVWISNLG